VIRISQIANADAESFPYRRCRRPAEAEQFGMARELVHFDRLRERIG